MSSKPVINLNTARKAKHRLEKRKQADENSRKFGRSKAEVKEFEAQKSLDIKKIDDHKLDI